MASTIGYTTHSDDTTVVFNVVAYFKPEKAHVTFLRKEHAVRIQVRVALAAGSHCSGTGASRGLR
jgi:hypothetical protein